jgi:uncharacterized protein YkwD
MKSNHPGCVVLVLILIGTGTWGCSGSDNGHSGNTAGALSIGGGLSSGGASGNGGALAVGGNDTGGSTATGGASRNGGASAIGGTQPTGGARATGGTKANGGAKASGGSQSNGGSLSVGGGLTINCTSTSGSSSCPEGVSSMCGMVAAHNAVRAAVTDANPPLPPLVWDCTLAAFAQAYANGCPADHNPNRTVEGQTAGENMAFFGGSPTLQSPTAVVALWAGEKSGYDYSTNTCSTSACGHYTQLVWRKTTAVGCGVATGCSGQFSQIWVCDYLPAGNYVGQKPY